MRFLLLAFLIQAATAQGDWLLPKGGAATYRRVPRWRAEDQEGRAVSDVGGEHRRVVPILFQSDLARRGRVRRIPFSIHGIGAYLAFDLTTLDGSKVDLRFPLVKPYGELILKGRAEPMGDSGTQEIHVTISRVPVLEGSADFLKSMEQHMSEHIAGKLTVVRRFDSKRGVVPMFTVTMDLVFTRHSHGEAREIHLTGSETWIIDQVMRRGYQFYRRVNTAIDRAVAYLREELRTADISVSSADDSPNPIRGPIYHARLLRGLALGGADVTHSLLVERKDKLGERDMDHPRTLSEAILAFSAIRRWVAGDRSMRRQWGNARGVIGLQWGDERRMKLWTRKLVEAADPAGQEHGLLRWSAVAGRRGVSDTLNSCRAIEALVVASSHMISVPQAVWSASARPLLASQSRIIENGSFSWLDKDGRKHRVQEACGWGSGTGSVGAQPNGSATASAIAALLAVRRKIVGQAALKKDIDRSVDLGLAWLSKWFDPRMNPSLHSSEWQRHSEWCEALPLALERARVVELGGRDWQFEMSMALLALQDRRTGATGMQAGETHSALCLWLRQFIGPLDDFRAKRR